MVGQRLTLLEILNFFPSIRPGSIPLSLLEQMVPLQPRYYSISCSPLLYPKSVHITAATVTYRSPAGFQHDGITALDLWTCNPVSMHLLTVCNTACTGVSTSFLNRQKRGDRVPIFIKPSKFKLPKDPQTPIIMLGSSTFFSPRTPIVVCSCYCCADCHYVLQVLVLALLLFEVLSSIGC